MIPTNLLNNENANSTCDNEVNNNFDSNPHDQNSFTTRHFSLDQDDLDAYENAYFGVDTHSQPQHKQDHKTLHNNATTYNEAYNKQDEPQHRHAEDHLNNDYVQLNLADLVNHACNTSRAPLRVGVAPSASSCVKNHLGSASSWEKVDSLACCSIMHDAPGPCAAQEYADVFR